MISLPKMPRVGQNHTYTVYIRYFWLGNHQIYGVFIRIYTVLANPTEEPSRRRVPYIDSQEIMVTSNV
jgi:hypothetical protein